MNVALLRADGVVIATARLIDAIEAQQASSGDFACAWLFDSIEPLEPPITFTPGGGPLWRRLSQAERNLLLNPHTLERGAFEPHPDDETSSRDIRTIEDAVEPDAELPPGDQVMAIVAGESIAHLDENPPRAGALDQTAPADGEEDTFPETQAYPLGGTGSAPESPNALSAARSRAFAYIPSRMVTVDEAYRLLVRLRDSEIKQAFPDARPEHGLLRRTLLQAMLDTGVASQEDYEEFIPADMRRSTERRQVDAFLEPVLEILAKVT